MPYLVTDNTCHHTIVTATDRALADHQAHTADLAGYPTTTQHVPTLTGRELCPPADCTRCWRRVGATIVIMQRDRIATAAITAGACPFEAVALFHRLYARGLTLEVAATAVTRPRRLAYLAQERPVGDWSTDALCPCDFHGPARFIEPPSRTP